METKITKKSTLEKILNNFDVNFFKEVEEGIHNSFAEAELVSKRTLQEPERIYGIAQFRHLLCEGALRMAAEKSGFVSHSLHTEPRGGRYSIVQSGGVYLLRTNIQTHCGSPRLTKFRKEWSYFNEWLEPQQMDFFNEVKEPSTDKLCVMLIVSSQLYGDDQSVPAYIGIGVPYPDLSGWELRKSISEILALYHDQDTKHSTQSEPETTIKDTAFPVLKKRN